MRYALVFLLSFLVSAFSYGQDGSAQSLENQKRMEAAAERHKLTARGKFVRAGEADIARQISMLIMGGQAPATQVQGIDVPGRSYADSLESLTGVQLPDDRTRAAVNKIFLDHLSAAQSLAREYCALSKDASYSNDEFLSATEDLQDQAENFVPLYQSLKVAVDAPTVVALQEREQELSHMMVETQDRAARAAFNRDVVDIVRQNHAAGCERALQAQAAGHQHIQGLIQ